MPPSSLSPNLLLSAVRFLATGQLHSSGHLANELGAVLDHVFSSLPTAKVSVNPPSSPLERQWTQPDDFPTALPPPWPSHRHLSPGLPWWHLNQCASSPSAPLSLFSTEQPVVLVPHSSLSTPSHSLPSLARRKPRVLTVLPKVYPALTLPPCLSPSGRHDPAPGPLHCASPPWNTHPGILWVFIEMPLLTRTCLKLCFLSLSLLYFSPSTEHCLTHCIFHLLALFLSTRM